MADSVIAKFVLSGDTATQSFDDLAAGRPLAYGPFTVEVDNGNDIGAIRTKIVNATFRLKSAAELDKYLPGDTFYLSAVWPTSQYNTKLMDGMISEVKSSPGPDGTVDINVTATSDKTRFEGKSAIGGSDGPGPIWREGDPPIDYPGTDGYMAHITNLYPLGDTAGMTFSVSETVGYAWYDGSQSGNLYWPHRLGTGYTGQMAMLESVEKAGQATGMRYLLEDKRGFPVAAKYAAMPPYLIPASCIIADNEFLSQFRDTRNRLSMTYTSVLDDSEPKTVTADYVRKSGERVPTYTDIVEERHDYADWLWELVEAAKGPYPRPGTAPLTAQMLVNKLAQRPHPKRNIIECRVKINKLLDLFGVNLVGSLLLDIFGASWRTVNSYLPSIVCDDPAGIGETTLYGIPEKATLTITPRVGMIPQITMDLTLGPGDGAPGDLAPLGGRFKDIVKTFESVNDKWSPSYWGYST